MNPLLGRLSDVWSRKWVLVLGSLSAAASAILALLVKQSGVFYLVFILTGIAATAFWTIGITISLEFGEEIQRPTYVGMANTLISPATMLAPLLGGVLADSFGYSITFITSAALALVSSMILVALVEDPCRHQHHHHPAYVVKDVGSTSDTRVVRSLIHLRERYRRTPSTNLVTSSVKVNA
jgi:MFS family permease